VIDIKWIREQPELVKQRLAARGGADDVKIDEVLQLDEQRRTALKQVEDLKALRNKASKEIGALMGQKKLAEAEAKKGETRTLGDQIAALDKTAAEAEAARDAILIRLPNPPHASVPLGTSAADNPEVKHWGAKPEFAFKPKSHVELCESLKLVDFARGAKLSGSGFLLYTNWGARLERALIQFLLELHTNITHASPRIRQHRRPGVPHRRAALVTAAFSRQLAHALKDNRTRNASLILTGHLIVFLRCQPRGRLKYESQSTPVTLVSFRYHLCLLILLLLGLI
jgi:hypothetical protein